MIGNSRSMPRPDFDAGNSGEESIASRARIQFLLPWTVLISPLCATYRYGCDRGQDGNVLVENREWTRARLLSYRSSDRSGKNGPTCGADSMPL